MRCRDKAEQTRKRKPDVQLAISVSKRLEKLVLVAQKIVQWDLQDPVRQPVLRPPNGSIPAPVGEHDPPSQLGQRKRQIGAALPSSRSSGVVESMIATVSVFLSRSPSSNWRRSRLGLPLEYGESLAADRPWQPCFLPGAWCPLDLRGRWHATLDGRPTSPAGPSRLPAGTRTSLGCLRVGLFPRSSSSDLALARQLCYAGRLARDPAYPFRAAVGPSPGAGP